MRIRPYAPRDGPALYEICLRTGAAGQDATARHADPDLLGHLFVGPYLAFAPDLAFVLEDTGGGGTPVGYVLGAADTAAFEDRCEREWWPPLRARYPPPPPPPRTPDQDLAALIHHPGRTPAAVTGPYPSHLHIDLLPVAQGQGLGRRLLERLLAALARAGSPGVHLGVARANERAVGFYRRLGFVAIDASPAGLTLARPLPADPSPPAGPLPAEPA